MGGSFSSAATYDVFCPPGPKVGWSSLLVGTFKIPRHRFILWLAILGRLSTLDKPWLQHLGTSCVLCPDALPETHEHLFFACSFATDYLRVIRREVSFHWPYTYWPLLIQWASVRWRGKHVVNASLKALLASLPVTPSEIKHAVFDIDEVKAPGPDGYSSGFFKAAWPIIGEEVTQAIAEFFRTGRLLKQIITKIIVQRMRCVLDKLISPSQNAFVLGRSIGDNILLAQELFHGYNQQHLPPRCALKVDLRKAYDTVEWDFLSAALTLFGFPAQFISWIEECVTTPSFSVCLNGSSHGYFRGARGLRQGDPMSPFLFVLVMEVLTLILLQFIDQDGGFSYHWRCGEVQLFQLGFADDLLLLSRADTSSIHIFKWGLMVFAELSGLHVNPQKSHLILSRSASAHRDTLLPILGYQEGHLPLRYLGLPLLASRLSIADCKPILTKIDDRIRGWEGIMLSFAGRVQLIRSVLSSLQVYWAMAFILPKTVIREVEKRLRSFLWKGCTGVGYAMVSWQQVCRPVSEGDLGIRDILALNKGLMSKYLWRIIVADRQFG
ncbi:UNVERIFIED_CONTAM: LINE-1 retrotransposable element O protein [Sesamum latifolium]|uniref:LINE-1 retrotransposable element O protein n=1 Tax=Sesamum latifolium TaxID=2727402 RepID=A0AAW2TB04_9LAMI